MTNFKTQKLMKIKFKGLLKSRVKNCLKYKIVVSEVINTSENRRKQTPPSLFTCSRRSAVYSSTTVFAETPSMVPELGPDERRWRRIAFVSAPT